MRKLSIAPLVILIAMFLWTRFASAAQPLPTSLPAKKKAAALPAKKAARAPKRTVIVVDAAPGLVKTLPAKKKFVLNFDQPALPSAPAVIVREDVVSLSTEDAAEIIQRRDVTEAPRLEFVGPEPQQQAIEIPNTATHTLRPALPDSDSFERDHTLSRIMPTITATPPVVVTAPPAVVSAPQVVVTAPPVVVTAPAVAAAPAPAPEVVVETQATATVSATTLAPQAVPEVTAELAGPPAPPLFDTSVLETESEIETASALSTKSTAVTAAETNLDADKGAPGTRPVELKASTTFLVPSNETPRRRLFVRGGYLDAPYSKLESDLKNGASLFGVSASQVFSKTEVRLGIDLAYGLDQSISLRNTRMAMFRAEGLYNLASFADTASVYIGGALGLADVQVTSFRSKDANGDVTVRENAKGTAFLGSPEIGSRIYLGRQVSFDLSVQYLLLMGGDQVSSLGGLLAEGALGFRF